LPTISVGVAVRAPVRRRRAIPQVLLAELLEAVQPLVKRRPTDAVAAAGRRHVSGDVLDMPQDCQAMPNLALLVSFVHGVSIY
jgi:hypothetical protein